MARSYKKAIIKEKPRNFKISSIYWRKIRRNWNITLQIYQPFYTQNIAEGYLELIFESPKSIYNDYDYCDYIFDLENRQFRFFFENHNLALKKYRRK